MKKIIVEIYKDSDLDTLRGDSRWQKLIANAEARQKEQDGAFWNKKECWDNPALKTAYQENISENEKIAGLSKFWSETKYNLANFDLIPDVNWVRFISNTYRKRETRSQHWNTTAFFKNFAPNPALLYFA